MKTAEEFNEKYKDFLEKGHYGLAIDNEEVVEYLDKKFQEFVKIPGFTYSQIKTKFNSVRFYGGDDMKTAEKDIHMGFNKTIDTFRIEKEISEILNNKTKKPVIEMEFNYNQDKTELYVNISEYEHPNKEKRISHNQVCIKGTMIVQFLQTVVGGGREIFDKFNK